MAYSRYFDIRKRTVPTASRPHRGATNIAFTLLGREKGGLCDSATAELPAIFPQDYGIARGDFFVCGWDSNASNQWFHGYVNRVTQNGPSSGTITIEALGFEHQLKSIYPRVNFGSDPVNTYVTYDNSGTTGVDDIVQYFFTNYIYGKVLGCTAGTADIDSTAAATDIVHLDFDGTTSLYDILNSLAERTGYSWGFKPTASVLTAHTFFFLAADSTYNPQFSKFVYGTNLLEVVKENSFERETNGLNVVGETVPKLNKRISRRFTYNTIRDVIGPIDRVKRLPGVRRNADAQAHAKAIMERRGDPEDSFRCQVIVNSSLTSAGPPIYPGQTIIKITDENGVIYNDDSTQQNTYEIKAVLAGKTIDLEFVLGESEVSEGELLAESSLKKAADRPQAAYDFDPTDPEEFTLDESWYNPEDRGIVIVERGIIETEPAGDPPTANVRLDSDGEGGSAADAYRELYTGIEVPTGLTAGDQVNIKNWFQDGELQNITTEAVEAGTTEALDETAVQETVIYKLATGAIPIFNTTIIRDIGDHAVTGEDDPVLVAGSGGANECRVGHLARVPAANIAALNCGVSMVRVVGGIPTYNQALADLIYPTANPEYARLYGRLLGITTNGEICLADLSGSTIIVNVKTGEAQSRQMVLIEATDPVTGGLKAYPLGAVTKANA